METWRFTFLAMGGAVTERGRRGAGFAHPSAPLSLWQTHHCEGDTTETISLPVNGIFFVGGNAEAAPNAY
jgi:hypothetical protein